MRDRAAEREKTRGSRQISREKREPLHVPASTPGPVLARSARGAAHVFHWGGGKDERGETGAEEEEEDEEGGVYMCGGVKVG